MLIKKAQGIGAKLLLSLAKFNDQNYGDKFSKFSQIVSQKFDRLCQIIIDAGFRRLSENTLLPSVIFAVIVLKKAQKAFEQPDFNKKEFLEDIKFKSKEIMAKGSITPENAADRFYECVACCLLDPTYLRALLDKHSKYIYELINKACDKKVKQFQMVDHYKPEQMIKIGNLFKEKVYFINYDDSKDALQNVPIEHNSIYLLKAKDMFCLLIKLQEISLTSSSKISHEDLAIIFNIGYKLQNDGSDRKIPNSPEKSMLKQAQPVNNQPSQGGLQLKLTETSTSKIQSQLSPRKQGSKFAVCKLKNSTLFPEEVKCKNCCRIISQFNALYWNYASYCLQCVVNPKVDVTFVPSNLIKKFLKNMHYDNNAPYQVVCPQCQAQGSIKNYRVDDKPKEYQCVTCRKTICIEHQRLIVQCFCFCIGCRKTTITIESLFQKYCPVCKRRLCELCNKKGTTECGCMCEVCGEAKLADHQCKGRCHSCKAGEVWLMQCPCGLKLCSMCYYKRFEPSEQTCALKVK